MVGSSTCVICAAIVVEGSVVGRSVTRHDALGKFKSAYTLRPQPCRATRARKFAVRVPVVSTVAVEPSNVADSNVATAATPAAPLAFGTIPPATAAGVADGVAAAAYTAPVAVPAPVAGGGRRAGGGQRFRPS